MRAAPPQPPPAWCSRVSDRLSGLGRAHARGVTVHLVDIARLAALLDISVLGEIITVHDQVIPGEPLPSRTLDRLRVYWGPRRLRIGDR